MEDTDLEHFDRAVKMQREYQGVLAKSTQGLQAQVDLMKEMEERARQRVSVEKLHASAASNLAKVQTEMTEEYNKLLQMTQKGLATTRKQTKYQFDIIDAYQAEVVAAKKLMRTADDLLKAEQDRVKVALELEAANKRGSMFADKLFSGVDRLLGKLPGGDIFRNMFDVDVIKSKVATDSAKVFKEMADKSISAASGMSKLGSIGSQALSKIAAHPVALVILALAAAIYASIKRFVELDKAAEEFRKTTGLITPQMGHISKMAREINVQMRHTGVGIEEAYKAAAALVETFQTAYAVTSDVTLNIARLAVNIGVAEGDSAKLYQTFLGMGNTTSEMAQNLMNAGVALANASGVPIAAVFKDIASASNDAMIFMGRSPILMLRTAVEARRLGTTMENLTKSARGLLNFQESINSEMEASAITGRALNFQAARQLAFQGDLVKSRQEAMRQIKSLGDFQKMSVYQQEAVAKAAGMEVSEIVKMQAQEKQLAALKQTNYALWKKQEDARKEASEATEKTLAQQGEELAKQQLRQAEITKITNQLKSIWTEISDALLPIAQVIIPIILIAAKLITINVKFIAGIIKGILSPLDKVLESFGGISGTIEKITPMLDKAGEWASTFGELVGKIMVPVAMGLSMVGKWGKVADWILNIFGRMMTPIKFIATKLGILAKIGGTVGKFAGIFGVFFKAVPIIGWVVTGIQAIVSWVKRLIDIWSSDDMNIWDKIKQSIYAIPKAISDAVIGPLIDLGAWILGLFGVDIPEGTINGIKNAAGEILTWLMLPWSKAWDWISDKFIGHSPSEIGKGIVNGIKSVVDTIFDLLTYPFRKAYEYLKKIPIIGKLFSAAGNIVSKITGDISQQVEAKTSTIVEIKNLDVLREAIDALTAAVAQLGSAATSAPTTTDRDKTADKIQELIDLLRNGAIAINLDGRKVSSALTNVGR